MPSVDATKEEWDASSCRSKMICGGLHGNPPFYRICRPCKRRVDDPSHSEICDGAWPRPPCPTMKENEPTMDSALDEFQAIVKTTKHCTARHVRSAIDLLVTSMTECWECHECNHPSSRVEEAFTSTHGASCISTYITDFCCWFLVRKCAMSDHGRRTVYTAMSKLTDFLFQKKYIDAEEKKNVKQSLTLCRSVKSEEIPGELQRLYDEGYWLSLVRAVKEEDEADEEPATKRSRSSFAFGGQDVDDDDDSYISIDGEIEDEMPLKVIEVTEDSWIFALPEQGEWYANFYRRMYNIDDGVQVMLPTEVAKLGRVGMEISCMMLQRRCGVWCPIGAHDEHPVCANVYPPKAY